MAKWYYCLNCETSFDDDDMGAVEEEICVVDGHHYYEVRAVCPHCNSEEFDEADMCERCGSIVPKCRLVDDFCTDCAKKLFGKFDAVMDEHFKAYEIEWLYNNWDWDDMEGRK